MRRKVPQTMAILFLIAALMASCSPATTPAPREVVLANVAPIQQADSLRDEVQALMRTLMWLKIDKGVTGQIRERRDIEYVYYHAAAIALAAGDLKNYHAYMALSRAELLSLKEYLKEVIAGKLGEH